MHAPLLDMEGTGSELAERLGDYADQRVRVIVLPAQSDISDLRNDRPIAETLAEIAMERSPEQEPTLPEDFTDQLDHYVYGSPKR